MPHATIIDLSERRSHYLDEAREKGREEGKRMAEDTFREYGYHLHECRKRLHARRSVLGLIGICLLLAVLAVPLPEPLQDYVLVLWGAAIAYTLMHTYRWDQYREDYRKFGS